VKKILSELSPSELCYIVVCARAGKGRSAEIEARDIFLLSGCTQFEVVPNKSHSAFVFYTPKRCAATIRKMLKRWGSANISRIMYCDKKIDCLECFDEMRIPKNASVHIRDSPSVFKGLKGRFDKSAKLSVEVFGESAFLCTEKWI